jgi:molybdopterin converting factor small subunit
VSKVNVSLSGGLATVAGTRNVEVEASNLAQVLKNLSVTFGNEFQDRLFDASGKPRRFINIYVNGRDYRFLKRLDTQLNANDHISLIPAVSGG